MNEPLISVIVPVYKVENVIERCIESIIGQTYRNLEIILVDDGTPDRSGEICDVYALRDSRIKVIHQSNKGLSGARNAGIDVSQGKYIAFVDSDDYIHRQSYEILLKDLLVHDVDIAMCSIKRFVGETTEESKIKKDVTTTMTSKEALRSLHGQESSLYTVAWNKLYKSSLIGNLRYPLGKLNEDEFLTYRFIDGASKISLNRNELYYYYQNEHSITTNSSYLSSSDVFEALEERKKYFIEKKDFEIVHLVQKDHMNRLIIRYKMQLDNGHSSEALKARHKDYRNYYIKVKRGEYSVGYKVFYYSPKVYYFLSEKINR